LTYYYHYYYYYEKSRGMEWKGYAYEKYVYVGKHDRQNQLEDLSVDGRTLE
jgi:hypothetical protein